jgi:lipoprotein-anchoring transpeptidase ErfK/SrfK
MLRGHRSFLRPIPPIILPAALALAGLVASPLAARAQLAPIISGIGPAQAARPAPDAERTPGAYGGGFLEYLVTSYSGVGARYNTPGEPARPIVQSAPAAPADAVSRLAGLGPGDASAEPREVPDAQYRRQEVAYDGRERPGTIIIDTPDKFLFLVEPNGRALRYGVGVGRPGFEWSGVKTVSRKAEWPGWTPPPEMLLRRPELPDHMDGGLGNPLGARALYLGSSMYRIHGTNEPWTIGKNVSSGCIRMMNQDVIDLYDRVPVGAKVVVI